MYCQAWHLTDQGLCSHLHRVLDRHAHVGDVHQLAVGQAIIHFNVDSHRVNDGECRVLLQAQDARVQLTLVQVAGEGSLLVLRPVADHGCALQREKKIVVMAGLNSVSFYSHKVNVSFKHLWH